MPSKNALKTYSSQSYYHIYNRGVEKKDIFINDIDKNYFLSLFNRYLDPRNTECDSNGVPYYKYTDDIELLSYCIMDNHYHLLIWVNDNPTSMAELMRSVGGSYSSYYNKKYDRVGPLFQGRYKAVEMTNDSQLTYISKYIHLNPGPYFMNYKYSSLRNYLGKSGDGIVDSILKPNKILEIFENQSYTDFLNEKEAV